MLACKYGSNSHCLTYVPLKRPTRETANTFATSQYIEYPTGQISQKEMTSSYTRSLTVRKPTYKKCREVSAP